MIVCNGLSKGFANVQALTEINMQVQRGDIFGLVGPDGAGKTTLIRTICGLILPDKGTVRLLGYPPGKQEKIRSRLGYMPQRFSLYGDLTVMENIIFFGSMYGLSKKIILERAEEILLITGMNSFQKRLADQLSGYEAKTGPHSALITRPEMLILDEPTYGVDLIPEKNSGKFFIIQPGRVNDFGINSLYDEAELCNQVVFY